MASEFTAAAGSAPRATVFDTRSSGRWIVSHLRCYPVVLVVLVLCQLASWSLFALMPVMIGRAAQVVIDGLGSRELLLAALRLLGVMAGNAAALISVMACAASLGHRLQRDARDELYRSLLGKSQTFHNRQRIGDLVARATDDTRLVNEMIHPAFVYLTDLPIGFVVTLTYVILIDPVLAVVPALYGLAFAAAVRDHMRRVGPALAEQRAQYGRLAAVAEEVITGIEVVKATVREAWERKRFHRNAGVFRDLVARQGRIEALNLALLAFGIATALALLHGIVVLQAGPHRVERADRLRGTDGAVPQPQQQGDEVVLPVAQRFRRGACPHPLPCSRQLRSWTRTPAATRRRCAERSPSSGSPSAITAARRCWPMSTFDISAGETVALVGQTGSAKTTLTQLVNRTYDPGTGRIAIDGVDLRDWNLTSLRSQVATIEQDVFLFSLSIADNIAFARPGAGRRDLEAAARAAAAHEFIETFTDGYDTIIGERGITLSGGQRQRIALAACLPEGPAHPDPGRLHQRHRQRHRGRDPARAVQRAAGVAPR